MSPLLGWLFGLLYLAFYAWIIRDIIHGETKMKFFSYEKDGGTESKVWGFFIVEIKRLLSVAFLHFKDGSREAFHSHAFNAVSWVLWGQLNEEQFNGKRRTYRPSLVPVWTPRSNFHMVKSVGSTFVISFRGPWVNFWNEYLPATNQVITLTHGRKVIDSHYVPRNAPNGLDVGIGA